MSQETAIGKTRLGATGPVVSRLALGCMSMSGMYGPSDEAESLATLHAALDAGVTLLDTGDFYGMGHNEMLIGRALRERREKPLLSVKFGGLRTPAGAFVGLDGRPAAVKNFAAYSLQRLGVERIGIYRMARLDPQVPIEETIGAMAELVREGYVEHLGLSEVGVETIRRARAVHPIVDLQIEYSLVSRGPEESIFPVLAELGIGVTAYGILSRGLLSGSKVGGAGDFRAHLPRFTGENRARNEELAANLARLAAERGCTPAQLATAWVMAKGASIVPLVGARKRGQLAESLGAAAIALTAAEVAAIEAAVPAEAVAGERYDAHQMKALDSEKG